MDVRSFFEGAPFNNDGLVRFQSQTIDPVVEDSSDEEENTELEFEDHVEYKVSRMLGGKPDAVKEQLAAVKSDAPFVPQQLHEKSFGELPLEVQAKTVKRFKNISFRYNEASMQAKGLLNENENGACVTGRNEPIFPACLRKNAKFCRKHPEFSYCSYECNKIPKRGQILLNRKRMLKQYKDSCC